MFSGVTLEKTRTLLAIGSSSWSLISFIFLSKFKRTKLEEYLKVHGKLIKSLPSVAISSGKYIGGIELKIPYVNYTDGKGNILKLRCTHIIETPNLPDGTPIDLYIDETNPTKYYTEYSTVNYDQPVNPTNPTANA